MSEWKWLLFEGAIGHMVPNELVDVIVEDLVSRDCVLAESKDGETLFLDQPGMVATRRPIEALELGGLKVEIPSEDFGDFIFQIESLKLRGGCYYKLHGFMRCVVLTEELKNELLLILRTRYPEAEARAMEFYHGKKVPSEVLREANAHANELPLDEVKNCGANKLDRFKVKLSGSLPN